MGGTRALNAGSNRHARLPLPRRQSQIPEASAPPTHPHGTTEIATHRSSLGTTRDRPPPTPHSPLALAASHLLPCPHEPRQT
jgi:hypothetical protein